jgi:hypothetical protein
VKTLLIFSCGNDCILQDFLNSSQQQILQNALLKKCVYSFLYSNDGVIKCITTVNSGVLTDILKNISVENKSCVNRINIPDNFSEESQIAIPDFRNIFEPPPVWVNRSLSEKIVIDIKEKNLTAETEKKYISQLLNKIIEKIEKEEVINWMKSKKNVKNPIILLRNLLFSGEIPYKITIARFTDKIEIGIILSLNAIWHKMTDKIGEK